MYYFYAFFSRYESKDLFHNKIIWSKNTGFLIWIFDLRRVHCCHAGTPGPAPNVGVPGRNSPVRPDHGGIGHAARDSRKGGRRARNSGGHITSTWICLPWKQKMRFWKIIICYSCNQPHFGIGKKGHIDQSLLRIVVSTVIIKSIRASSMLNKVNFNKFELNF